jgi:hypothetical protein
MPFGFCFFVPRLPKDTHWVFIWALAATVITALGLLIRSNFIRWLGGVFMVIWAGALLWPLISGGMAQFSRPNSLVFFSYYGFRGALSLLTAAILLLSKQFAYDFAKLREADSKYIIYSRRLLIWGLIAAAAIATFNDIVNLASSP